GGAARVAPPQVLVGRAALLVERTVDLGDFLRLGRLTRLALAVSALRLAAEIEAEAGEVEPVAAVGADLIQRRQQRLALVRLLRHLLGRADVDRAVALEAG